MHKTIAVLLGIVCFLPVMAKAGGAETDATDASDVKTLFFNHDDRVPSPILPNRRGMPSGN